jgi:hypothetical protein
MMVLRLLLTGFILIGAVSGSVAAANNTTAPAPDQEPSDGGNTGHGIGQQLQNAITSVLMDSVEGLAKTLNGLLTRIFVSYPDVEQSFVLEIHQKVFQVTLALSSAAAAWLGVLHMLNRVDGIRQIVSLLGAVAIGGVAPSLLWYPIELSRLTTEALIPVNPGLIQVSRFTFELLLVLVIDVFLLLETVMIFIARDVYLMLGVAMSPLIALMAVTHPFRRFADRLTGIWVACLVIGPLNAVTLDLTLSLMGTSAMDTPHYLWGLGGIALLFGIPVIVLGAGAVVFAPMTRIASRGSSQAWSGVRKGWNKALDTGEDQQDDRTTESADRGSHGNRFRRDRGDD